MDRTWFLDSLSYAPLIYHHPTIRIFINHFHQIWEDKKVFKIQGHPCDDYMEESIKDSE